MGLFSFLKSAGAKILGRSTATETTDNAEAAKAAKISALEAVVSKAELTVDNLSVDLEDDRVTVYGVTDSVAVKEKVVLALGNVQGIATVDDRISIVDVEEPEAEADFYEVQSGDSLSKIAKRYYGDPMKYNAIFEANQPLLSDPNKIYPGQMLRIPKAIA
jgi:nucleoid-associated protein YgaU